LASGDVDGAQHSAAKAQVLLAAGINRTALRGVLHFTPTQLAWRNHRRSAVAKADQLKPLVGIGQHRTSSPRRSSTPSWPSMVSQRDIGNALHANDERRTARHDVGLSVSRWGQMRDHHGVDIGREDGTVRGQCVSVEPWSGNDTPSARIGPRSGVELHGELAHGAMSPLETTISFQRFGNSSALPFTPQHGIEHGALVEAVAAVAPVSRECVEIGEANFGKESREIGDDAEDGRCRPSRKIRPRQARCHRAQNNDQTGECEGTPSDRRWAQCRIGGAFAVQHYV